MNEKIKILYLSSSPSDQTELEVDTEFRAKYEKLDTESRMLKSYLQKDKQFREMYEKTDNTYFKVVSVSNLKASELQAVVLKTAPEIIHFSGHASADEIFFEDAEGKSKGVSKNALVNFLSNLSKKPVIVFFNACRTADKLKSLSQTIDFVVVTQREVDDDVAVTFAAKFYEFLSLGQTIKTAFVCAKNHFEIEGRKEAAEMYKLFMRGEDRSLSFPEKKEEEKIVDSAKKEHFVTKSNIQANEVSGIFTVGKIENFRQITEKK